MFGIKLLFILLIIVLMTISGTLVFIKGFLLSRSAIEAKSQCSPEFALRAEDHSHHGVEGCWMHGRFRRAIVVIIDALKYEFMTFNSSLQPSDATHYKNKLPVLDQLLRRKPLHSRLYKFIADPPTTTMQRLKGLTTGSLPTFVDAGANFHSYAITEDNLIDQMVKQDKQVKFFGDDTWLSLFPNKFYKSFDFPSFDVKDLHTVDNGVLKHIYPEMRQANWDVIIAHFLGVDHCGHKFGPNHSAMAEKLTQMNAVIKNITELMRDDTVLFVMGDHGMTKTGDHGGDSPDELESGLFIYSRAQIASAPQQSDDVAVAQTDFVPTLALLLGLPIPFSNLGMVIPELFGHCPWWDTASNEIRRVYHRVKALRLNAQQINTYLSAYQQTASDLPVTRLRSLQQQVNMAESDIQSLITAMIQEGATSDALHRFNHLEDVYKSYIRDAREMCETVWAKFDLKLIVTGLLTVAAGVSQAFYFLIVWDNSKNKLPTLSKFLLGGSALHVVYLTLHMLCFPETVPPLMAFILALVLIVVSFLGIRNSSCVVHIEIRQYLTTDNVTASVILIMNCCLYFSNSFIVHEDIVTMFLIQTLICLIFLKIVVKNYSVQRKETKSDIVRHIRKSKTRSDLSHAITQPSVAALVMTILFLVILRTVSSFYYCREEQHLCENYIFIVPLSSLEEGIKNQRYIFSLFCISSMVYAVRYWLKHYGNMNGTSPGVTAAYYGPPLAALFIVLHWALQALPQSVTDSFRQWQQALMAQFVYAIIIVSLAVINCSPLLVYVLPIRADSPIQIPYQAHFRHIVPTLYNQLKVRLSGSQASNSDADNKPPMVYGLGSVYSSSVVILVSVVSLLLALLLGDGLAPSLLLATVLLFLYLELYSAFVTSHEYDYVSEGPTWSSMVILSLLSTIFFFATGHQATIPSIRFESAYTGFYGDFNTMLLPGFLIWLNTFAGPILFNLACPLLLFWPLLSSALVRQMIKRQPSQKQNEESWKGDFQLYDNATLLRKNLFRVCCGMIAIGSVKLLASACAAALHRRHLMVWKIFAPRFIFEAASFVTASICVMLAFLFVLRVDNTLSAFIKTLPAKKQN